MSGKEDPEVKRKRQQLRRKKKREAGLCRECPKKIFRCQRCKACYEKFKKDVVPAIKKWMAKRVALGFCVHCGGRRHAKGKKSCTVCLRKGREYDRNRRKKR